MDFLHSDGGSSVAEKGKGPGCKRWIGVKLRDSGGKCFGDDDVEGHGCHQFCRFAIGVGPGVAL